LDGIEQNKEYYDARMSSRKGTTKAPNHVHPESQKQPQVVIDNPIEPPEQVQAFDQGRNMVPSKCLKCQGDIMGPPHDRGGDNTRTWHKFCKECHASIRRAGGKYKSETRSIQQVEEVNEDRHEPDGVFGPCEYNGTNGCYMVNVHRSEQEQVTTKVLNVLTDGRPNKGVVDYGVIVDSGAAVTLTNLEAVDSRRIVENSTKPVEPPVINLTSSYWTIATYVTWFALPWSLPHIWYRKGV
jgi:hypothetical protein